MDGRCFSVELKESATIRLPSLCLNRLVVSQSYSGKMRNDTCYVSLAITGVVHTTTETGGSRHSVDSTFPVSYLAAWKKSGKVFLYKAYQAKLGLSRHTKVLQSALAKVYWLVSIKGN